MLIRYILRQPFHPLWEGEGGGSGSGSGDPANPGAATPPANPPADPPRSGPSQEDLDKAYTKLREAEAERDRFKTENRTLKSKDLPDSEKLKAENDDLKTEIAGLRTQVAETAVASKLTSKARELGYKKPDAAMGLLRSLAGVDPSTLDTDDKVDKALRDLASSEEYLVDVPPPSGGPVNRETGKPSAGNAGFNQAIRQAAGRS